MRAASIALGLLMAVPLEAQYRRGVLVYDSSCPLRNAMRLETSGGASLRVTDDDHGVLSLEAASGVTVTMSLTGPNPESRSVVTTTQFASVLYSTSDEGPTCRNRIQRMTTDSLFTWTRSTAADADRERRKWGRIRNALLLGGVAVLGATVYNFNNEVERDGEGDAVTLVAGTALGLTIGYLAFNQAQPEVVDYTRRRNRYRDLERGILEQSR